MEDTTRRLGEEKISKLLWQFSLPSIIGTLASSVYVIIDRIFVGQVVGPDALAGLSVTMPISFIILAFGLLVGVGSGALVSIRLGQGKREEAENILGNAFTLVLIISVVVSGLLLFYLERLLTLFGASQAILPYAKNFIGIILFASFFQYTGFGLSNIIRAEGNPRKAMYVVLINAGTNIVLDIVFILWLGWGVRGAAIATVISQGVSAAIVLYHFCYRSNLRLRLVNMRLHPNLVRTIFSIGMAPFAMQLAASVVNTLFNQNLAQYGGDPAIGAFGVIGSILNFLILPVIGINMGSQPIIGFNYGARHYDRVIETLKDAIIAATAVTTAGFVLLELFPGQMLGAFTNDAAIIKIGTHGMRLIILMLPVVGFQIVCGNLFQAIGKGRLALLLALLRQVVILIPALMILPRLWQLNGIWISGPIADGLATMITLLILLPEIRSLRNQHEVLPRENV
ncbi:MAG: MATE family efflux transporter [Deltaproteobacteria bacterium]